MSSNSEFSKQAPGATGVDSDHPAHQPFVVVDADGGEVAPADGVWRKRIAVCGFAASTRMAAPFDDPEYVIMGLNQLYRHIPRADIWWDIHSNWAEDNVPGTDHPGYLAGCGMPVFMSTRAPELPTAVTFPLEAVTRDVVGADYFTSTVAYMIAWSIWQFDRQVAAEVAALAERARWTRGAFDGREDNAEDAELAQQASEARELLLNPEKFLAWRRDRYVEREIAIYGIDLIVGEEYDFQKACVEYILGLAEARNIKLRIPRQSALLKHRWRYGYEQEPAAWPIRMSELQRRASAINAERAKTIAHLQTLDGALQENQYWTSIHDLRSKGGDVRLNEATSS